MSTTTLAPLDFYANINAALFPIPAGSKAPFGLVASFKHDFSRDPAVWKHWATAHPGCNFGIVAFASQLIICDIDTSGGEGGRNEAWALWCALCAEWGVAPLMPHVASARGGWHVYLQVPADIDASTLRQPDAVRDRINIRCVGYTVAAGSYYDGTAKGEESGAYTLLSDAPPHSTPAALLAHCTRAERSKSTSLPGSRDKDDVAKLLVWMNERGAFEDYESWFQIGMSLRVEYGEDGFDLWALIHDDTVSDDLAAAKWESFSTEPDSNSVTLSTFLQRAHQMGWRGQVRKSLTNMFDGVAAIAQAAGATLASAAPAGAIPLADTQRIVAALGQPIVDRFLSSPYSGASCPLSSTYPTLPDTMGDHPLFDLMGKAIERIVAMGEDPKTFRQDRVLPVLGVYSSMHLTSEQALYEYLVALGAVISPGKHDSALRNFEGKVRVETNTAAGFIVDNKGFPASENSDNVHVFLRQRDIQMRYNVWKDTAEICDNDRDEYEPLSDHIFGDLLMDAKSSRFNYHPAKELFRIGLISRARQSFYDPVLERIEAAGSRWDGLPRLDTWLSRTVGVAADAYHAAVGRNIIGGMVRRARHPGCKHDETAIFISPEQGTGKSTLTKILALDPMWHTDSIKLGGRQQDLIPQMAGKWIIELGELAGMSKTEVEDVKQFMSSPSDNYTKKYEAFATEHPRRCIFIGTSNNRRPLTDDSGNRRFLPVHVVGEVNLDWIAANIEQLIGEAAAREAAGETFVIPRPVWDTATAHQEAARNMSPVEELCYEWFDRPAGQGMYITSSDLRRGLKMAGQNQSARYAQFMEKMGWRDANTTIPLEGKGRVWIRHHNNRLDDCIRLVPQQKEVNAPVIMRMTGAVRVATPPLPGGPIMPPPY